MGGESSTAGENVRMSDRDTTRSSSSDERVFAVVSTLKSSQPAAEQPSVVASDDLNERRPARDDQESTPGVKTEPTVIGRVSSYYYYYYIQFNDLFSRTTWAKAGTRKVNHSGFCWSRR